MNIEQGGKTEWLTNSKTVNTVAFFHEMGRKVYLNINDNSLSYLTLDEAITIRDQLNVAIAEAAGLPTQP